MRDLVGEARHQLNKWFWSIDDRAEDAIEREARAALPKDPGEKSGRRDERST